MGFVMGKHFGLGMELGLIFAVVHLSVSGGDNEDRAVGSFEAEGFCDTGLFHSYRLGRQFDRGGRNGEFLNPARNSETVEIGAHFLNRHEYSILSLRQSRRMFRKAL